jgi:hypothetical protein
MPGTTSTLESVIGAQVPSDAVTSIVTDPTAVMGRRSLLATEMVLKRGSRSVVVVRSDSEGTMCLVQPPLMIQAFESDVVMKRAES